MACLLPSFSPQELPNVTGLARATFSKRAKKHATFYGPVIRTTWSSCHSKTIKVIIITTKKMEFLLLWKLASWGSWRTEVCPLLFQNQDYYSAQLSYWEEAERKSGQLRLSSRLNLIIFSRLFDHSSGCCITAECRWWNLNLVKNIQ